MFMKWQRLSLNDVSMEQAPRLANTRQRTVRDANKRKGSIGGLVVVQR